MRRWAWLFVPRRKREQGFSLVETLAALLVFAVITLGLVPLLAASIRGSDISRRGTVGKNLVTEAMERARGFPFHISYSTQARKVDVLDLYFPSRTPTYAAGTCTGYLNAGSVTCTSTNYTATGPSYVTTCPNASNIGCPQNIPTGYTVTYEASFATVTAGTPETYARFTPATTYRYDLAGSDTPQTLLIQLIVTARWTGTGRGARTYQVRSLLSDRKFSGLKILGDAAVDYGVQLVTGYSDQGPPNKSELTATAGNAVSHIETRRIAAATQSVKAGEVTLIDLVLAEDDIEGNENFDSTPRVGVEETVFAPPDTTVNPTQVTDPADVDHPNNAYGFVASIDTTDSDNVSASVASTLPSAAGEFSFSPSSSEDILIANNRADTSGNPLNLQEADEWIARVITQGSDALAGNSSCTTNSLGTQPGVACSATTSFSELQLFRMDHIGDEDDIFDGAAVAITGPESGGAPSGVFSATATCNADNDGTQNSTAASATYEGTLWYWSDPTENNDDDDGAYVPVPLAPGTDELAAIESGSPILVWDTNPDSNDLYLFPNGSNAGLLANWSNTASASTSVGTGGRVTSARIENAVSIETQPVEGSSQPETAVAVGIGSVNCRAEDYR
ncbi:MAG TPA: prepilin-type N-terminal cleavage/methylation domain-containing protein [Actinomycetota bacterium]|nr:prepilin-type N-terminal cleavage/methylation domain-containing protein [Actinomycetota bacterium]